MSADLEKLANYFRQQGDIDLELVLRGAALTSRSRNRAASVICPEHDKENSYFGVQNRILDALIVLAPKKVGYNYTKKGMAKLMHQFYTICGKYMSNNVGLRSLVMPVEDYFRVGKRLTEEEHTEIRGKVGQVNDTVKREWNTTMYELSTSFGSRRRKIITSTKGLRALRIGDIREMEDTEILRMDALEIHNLQVFRAAFSGMLYESPKIEASMPESALLIPQASRIS